MQMRSWVDAHKPFLRLMATLCLVTVPYTQIGVASNSGSMNALSAAGLAQLAAVIVAAQLLMRAFNAVSVELFQFGSRQPDPRAIKRAVVLAASQKTLPIAITVLIELAAATGLNAGLAALPCVVAHFSQVVIDSFLVSWWKGCDADRSAA
jgi:solute carrier family 10 (sodium/bile acid cotransporter), member 7